MRKTTLFLLSSVSILAACYTSPEMNEGRYEDMYVEDESACIYNEDTYQHKGLRKCLETKAAYESANKKTVQIFQQKDGTALVVPKTYDDSLMVEENRVYQVVERDSNTVFVESSADVSEDDIAKLPVETTAISDESHSVEPSLVVEEEVSEKSFVDNQTIKTQTSFATREAYEVDQEFVDDKDPDGEYVEYVEYIEPQDEKLPVIQVVVEAENPAPPQVIPVVEEVAEIQEETEDEECDCDEDCCENEITEETSSEDDLTFTMQPSDDEVIISIKTKKKSGNTSEKPCSCKQKKGKEIETFKKNEKEYLPLEEK